jgi:hypothetical protein
MAAEAQVEETGETGWLRRDGAVLLCGLVRPALMERPVCVQLSRSREFC